MKKMIIMAVAALIATTTVSAQHNGHGRGERGGMRNDGVVNIELLQRMEIDSATINKVIELQKQKSAEMREAMKAHRGEKPGDAPKADKKDKKDKKEKKMDMEKFGEQMAKMKDFRAAYRAELRKILGTETYITYLEEVQDASRMQRMNRMQGGFPQGGPQGGFPMGGPQGGFPMGGGF